jgi:type I restriction enzyme, S subunit
MSFPKYEAYKDSGVEWLGEVPEHWGIKPIWSMFNRTKRTGYPEEELLSVYRDFGVIPKSSREDNFNKPSDDLSSYQLVEIGDLAINKMKAWQGSVAISDYRGIVSPAYHVYSSNHQENSRYLHHLFRCSEYITGYLSNSKGIRVNQWDLEPQQHSRMPVLLPSISEQIQIARFLDWETSRIDELIAEQQRLIELLKEKRQAVISHAVTKGLDPTAPMKDSGVEWVGNIPKHWKMVMVKHTAQSADKSFTDGDWIESPYITEDGIRLIQTGNVGIGQYKEKGFRYISEESFKDLRCTEIFPNDVLICRLDGPVARACLVPDLGVRMITSVDNAILKPSEAFDPRFIMYAMSSNLWLEWIEALCRVGGGFRFRISRSMLGDLRIPAPPINEQKDISDTLDAQFLKLDELAGEINSAVEILQERRSALISAAVTGKIDVRNWHPPD